MSIVAEEYETTFVFLDIIAIIGIQRVRELWLQSRITLRDVKWVGVVCDVEQLCDVWLSGVAAISQTDRFLVTEVIVKIQRRREINDVTDSINIDATIVLNEIRVLRLYQETNVVVVLLLPVAQSQTDVVRVVLIFRVATEVLVELGIHRF